MWYDLPMRWIYFASLAAVSFGCKPGWIGSASVGGNAPPVVSIASPSTGAAFVTGDTILVEVAAVDTDGTIQMVELVVNGALVASATAAPFPLNWNATAAGEHQLTARARDDGGATAVSTPVLITVVPPGGNFPPTVRITSPADGASVPGDSPVSLAVDVGDTDGSVTRVEYFADGLPIGEAISAPFALAWALPFPGARVLTAIAHDDGGATGNSTAVTATVLPISNPVSGSVVVNLSFPSHERSRGVYLWLETVDGTYVDTIEQYFGRGPADGYPDGSYAVTGQRHSIDKNFDWRIAAAESAIGPLVLDGETRASAVAGGSGGYISATWDCLTARGDPIPAGNYTIRLEVTFDATSHPSNLPVHHYSGALTLGPGNAMGHLGSLDNKVGSASVVFTPQ